MCDKVIKMLMKIFVYLKNVKREKIKLINIILKNKTTFLPVCTTKFESNNSFIYREPFF